MIEVIPILAPTLNWQPLFKIGKAVCGKDLNRGIDLANLDLENPRSVLLVLRELFERNPILEEQLVYGFLVLAPSYFFVELLGLCLFKISTIRYISSTIICGLVSGSLEDWRRMFREDWGKHLDQDFVDKTEDYFRSIGVSI